MTMKLFVGVFLIGLAASACAATQHGPAWTRVEQCAGDPARCSSGCASGDGNMCALFAVLDVEAHQPTLDSLPIKKVRDLVVDTRAACLVSREPRACAASDLAATAYAKRPDHDAELLASSAEARAMAGRPIEVDLGSTRGECHPDPGPTPGDDSIRLACSLPFVEPRLHTLFDPSATMSTGAPLNLVLTFGDQHIVTTAPRPSLWASIEVGSDGSHWGAAVHEWAACVVKDDAVHMVCDVRRKTLIRLLSTLPLEAHLDPTTSVVLALAQLTAYSSAARTCTANCVKPAPETQMRVPLAKVVLSSLLSEHEVGEVGDSIACNAGDETRCVQLGHDLGATAEAVNVLLAACDRGTKAACLEAANVSDQVSVVGPPYTSARAVKQHALLKACTIAPDADLCARAGDIQDSNPNAPRENASVAYSKACDLNVARACRLAAGWWNPTTLFDLYKKGCELGDAESCTDAGLTAKCGLGDAESCDTFVVNVHVGAIKTETDAAAARKLFTRGCELGSGAGCRGAGNLDKACGLHDAPACDKLCAAGNAQACDGATAEFKAARAAKEAARRAEASLPGLFSQCAANRVAVERWRIAGLRAQRAGDTAGEQVATQKLHELDPRWGATLEDLRQAIALVTNNQGARFRSLLTQVHDRCSCDMSQSGACR